MKYIKNTFLLSVICSTLLLSFYAHPSFAVDYLPYSQTVSQRIEQNCSVIKNSLDTLRTRDISSRVSRVYVYDFLLARTQAFATRLANNKINNQTIVSTNQTIATQLDKFKTDYSSYDDQLTTLRSANCNNSHDFYNKLQDLRSMRSDLATDVNDLQVSWQTMQKAIDKIQPNEKVSNSEGIKL